MAKSQSEYAEDFLEELVSCQNPQQNLSYSMQLKRMEYMLGKAAAARASRLNNGVKSAKDIFGVKSEGASRRDNFGVKPAVASYLDKDKCRVKPGGTHRPGPDEIKYGAAAVVDVENKNKPASTRRPDEIKYAESCPDDGKKYGASHRVDVKTKPTRRPDEIKYAVSRQDNCSVKSEVVGRRVDVETKSAAAIRRPDDGKQFGASRLVDVENKPASTRRPVYVENKPASTRRPVDVENKPASTRRPVDVENKPASTRRPDEIKYAVSRPDNFGEKSELAVGRRVDIKTKPAPTRRPNDVETNKPAVSLRPDDGKKYTSLGLFFPDDNSGGVKSGEVASRPDAFKLKAATRVSRPDDEQKYRANPFDDQIKPTAIRRPDDGKKYTVIRPDDCGVKSEVAGTPVDVKTKPASSDRPDDGKKYTASRPDNYVKPAASRYPDDRKKLTANRERKQYASYSEDGEIKSESAASLRDKAQNPHHPAFVPYVKIRASKALEALGDSKRYRARLEKKIKTVKDEIKGMDGELDKHRFKYDGLNCILKIGIASLLKDIQNLDSNVIYLNQEIEKEKRRNEILEKAKLDKKKEEMEKIIKVDESQAQFIKDLAKSSFLSSFLSHQVN